MKRLIAAAALICGLTLAAAPQARPALQLKSAVILTRHGVRAPTWTPDRLNQYSIEPWPDFGVPPGNLTPRGRELMKLIGEYYRQYFSAQKLLGKPNCDDSMQTYFWADTDQRTLETAHALAETILPGCKAEVHSMPGGKPDPLFDPIDAGTVKPDPALARAAVAGRIGPNLNAIIDSHRAAFDVLNRALVGNGKPAASIFDQPMSLTAGANNAALSGALATASTFTENLLLEYTNGMTGKQFAWGRISVSDLHQIMTLHTTYADLMRRTPYLARARGSILLNYVARAIEQSVSGKPIPGTAPAGNALVVISGHDTNISNLSGALGLSWMMPTYQPDDVPPGGALVFSLWQDTRANRYYVRLQFVAQTMEQMHAATKLSLDNPPAIADVFITGCSSAQEGFPCEWAAFKRTTDAAIDPAFIK